MKILMALLMMSSMASAQTPDSPQIQVEGVCSIKENPNMVSVSVTIAKESKKSSSDAINEMNSHYNTLVKEVKKLGLNKQTLTSSNYYVQEMKDWDQGKSVFRGYRAQINLDIQTEDLDKVVELLKTIQDQSVEGVSGLSFSLSKEKMDELKQKCYKPAVQQAKLKATSLAEGLDLVLGKVLLISMGAEGSAMPRPMPMMRSKAMDSSSLEVETGSSEIEVRVNVVFEIKNK